MLQSILQNVKSCFISWFSADPLKPNLKNFYQKTGTLPKFILTSLFYIGTCNFRAEADRPNIFLRFKA